MTTLTRSPMRRTPFKRKPLGQRDPILTSTTPRRRKCAVCAEVFKPLRMGQKVCSPACAQVQGRRDTEKQERKDLRERKAKLKTRSDWMKEAQAAVNAYVRARDADLPCISCGRHHEGQWHAGHYLARGSHPHLALVEDNLHKQCAPCNTYLSGNQQKYRVGLIARIGLERVETLEADNTPRHYTIDDLKRMKAEYAAKLRALKEKAE